MRRLVWLSTVCATILAAQVALAAPEVELGVERSAAVIAGQSGPPQVVANCFGPAIGGVTLPGHRDYKSQLQWTFPGPEGDYTLGQLIYTGGYLHCSEFVPGQLHLYHNDQRVNWTNHTEPLKPASTPDQSRYQVEMLTGPLHLQPGDSLRVVFAPDGAALVAGPLRLYRQAPAGVQALNAPDWGRPTDYWLKLKWLDSQRQGDTVTETCELYNPGALPRIVKLRAVGKDFFERLLVQSEQSVTVPPGGKLTRTFSLKPGGDRRVRLTVTADGASPQQRLVKYWVSDVTEQPRPTYCLNGEWERCTVAAVEPGLTPPSDAVWQKIKVPSLQPNDKGHCAWYRRAFDAPTHVGGERLLLRFDQALTEAWVYLNGQSVGHELHGSQPFTVDVTAAYKPGQRNELLVAVRDWIAYSPRNQERVRRGEAPLYKDGMVDVAGYLAAGSLGLGGPVYLEARPAVAVEDVFIVTSVRNKKLSLRYRLRNDGATAQTVKLTAQVLDAGQAVKSLTASSLTVPAHGTVTKTLETPWADPKLWWPEDPHLYNLQTDLKPASGASDRLVTRFGFRELWIDGIAFMLNGVRTKIRSQWASGAGGTWPMAPFTDPGERAAAAWAWQERWVNEGAHQLTRTHGQAGVQELCDVADETGLMVKLESECNQVNFTFDQRFWNAVIAHELHVMDVYKNHPAVTMWSAGNENMWGWIYQGEAAKVLGNRWQIKTVKAMREFDLMRRPIEWEADGDLMGGWEHHALHYPRELTDSPGVPTSAWWGPLDRKTIVPYSMGPITLGQKPLTVGEAFWPATLNKPLGATVIVGDEAYASTAAYGRAWMESSAFFINGFRDVEFALIDIYNPLWLIAPQSIVLKQEDRAFYGDQTLRRDLNIHNDLRVPAKLTLRWSLTVGTQKKAGAEQTLALSPAELKRLSLSLPLPTVREVTPTQLRLELFDNGKLVHVQTRDWRLYPQTRLTTPAGLKLSLYDPLGETAQALRTAGVPFERQAQLKAPAQGALLLGRDSLKQAPEGPWREELLGFVRSGGKLAVLEQSETPDFLPVPLTAAKQRKITMAYARATDHPLLAGLDDWALRWWAPDHYVSEGNYRKPSQGNFLPLIDAGTGEGIIETPLLEEYEGKGSIVLCQMLLTDKLGVAPQATLLWQNLLSYLAAPLPFRQGGATALFAGANSPLRKALKDSAVIFADLTGKPEQLQSPAYQVAVADVATALDEGLAGALRQFAQGGGHVLLHRATPDQQKLVETALGCRVRFAPVKSEPDDIQNHVVRGPSAGLLSGLSNHEFFWGSNAYYAIARHEGDWWTGYEGGCPPTEYIADYFCSPDDASGVAKLTRPGVLLQAPCGSGYVALSQMRLDEPVADCAVTVARLRSLLLTNLGCTLQGSGGAQRARQQRLQQYDFFSVDLSPFANRGLRDDKAAGLVGWTNQGENDMRALPTGRQVLAGIPFQIMSPKGAVVLFSTNANNADLPREVKGLKVGRKADVLFFLHSVAWGSEKPFRYRVNYDDGTSVDVSVINGQQVIDWWQDPAVWADSLARGGGFVGWQGDNPVRKGVVLPGFEWTNPQPDKVIRDVDFLIVPDTGAVPVLVAITGAVSRPRQGVVVDVIGTAGVKVQLGTQVEDVLYIGVAGVPEKSAFYAKAVAAHRALAVGRKVTLVDDIVTRNAAGQRLAYVYSGDVYSINNLLNGRIIGDGLGKPGNFEGNTRQRMYLDNLGFIASQRKAGVYGVSEP